MWHCGGGELPFCLSCTIQGRLYLQIGIVTEEADECVFWIELLSDLGIVKKKKLHELLQKHGN